MKRTFTRAELLHELKNIVLIILGSAILGFGTGIFIVPFDLVSGGVSSLAIIVEHLLPFSVSVDVYVTVITWLLFFLGLITLGKNFALKTLISAIVYPIAFSLSSRLCSPDVLNGFFYLQGSSYQDISILLAALFGGILVGAGCAITFLGGGSTGGVDVIAFLICKIFRRLKSSVVIFVVDAAVIVGGMFIIGDLVISLLGICSAFICAIMIEYVFLGSSKSFVAQVISEKADEINQAIIEELDRSTTIIPSFGGYSGQPKKVLLVSFTIRQYSDVISLVTRIDKRAFMIISPAHEVNGEGWTYHTLED